MNKVHKKEKRYSACFNWEPAPKPPGFIALWTEIRIKRAVQPVTAPYFNHLLRRSGRFPALPYPPDRYKYYNQIIENHKPNILKSHYKSILFFKNSVLTMGSTIEEMTKFYGTVFIGEHGVSIEDIEKWRTTILEKRELVFNELAKLYQAT